MQTFKCFVHFIRIDSISIETPQSINTVKLYTPYRPTKKKNSEEHMHCFESHSNFWSLSLFQLGRSTGKKGYVPRRIWNKMISINLYISSGHQIYTERSTDKTITISTSLITIAVLCSVVKFIRTNKHRLFIANLLMVIDKAFNFYESSSK